MRHPKTTKETILLVDDDELALETGQFLLLSSGFEVVTAANGAEGLEIAKRLNSALSLVVSDVDMPILSGPEFAHRLRTILPALPVIFVSGRNRTWIEETYASYPRDAELLEKPYKIATFLALIRRTLVTSQLQPDGLRDGTKTKNITQARFLDLREVETP